MSFSTIIDFFKTAKLEYKIASVITLLLILFFIISSIRSINPQLPPNDYTQKDMTVLAEQSVAQDKVQQVTLYGFTESSRVVELKAETASKVTEILATESMPLKKGDIIVTLAEENRDEQLKQAKALVKQRKLEHKVTKELNKQELESETKLASAYTHLLEAQAQLAAVEQDIGYTMVTSPFDGVLERVHVEIGDSTKARDTVIASVVDTNPLLAVGYLPERHVHNIKLGQPAIVIFNKTLSLEGTIRYISKVADPKTRTFRIEAHISNPDYVHPDGLSVDIVIPYDTVKSHYVPSSILMLDKDGHLGINAITSAKTSQIVTFYPVTIIDEDSQGVWVTGLPDIVDIIVRGQAFVSEGDNVSVTYNSKKGH